MKILVLNAGSSSQKSSLYELPKTASPLTPLQPLWSAHIDWTVIAEGGELTVKTPEHKLKTHLNTNNRQTAIAQMLDTLVEGETKVIDNLPEINLVGHRVVHGGTDYSEATIITPAVKEAIARLSLLAPNHNPANLEGIEIIEQLLPNIPQVAVFDTAFHSQLPLKNAVYPIPYQWFTKGIRRYGFHGISHQYCSQRTAQILNKPLESLKIITCHLGNGCSLAAIKDGISIDTTMGFTPLEGLMMGTRSGSIDPAILIHLIREYDFNATQLDTLLNKESGLKGISGLSADLRSILAAITEGNQQAELAFEMYIDRLKKAIVAMLVSLGGLDVLVFTAGVGENAVLVREKTCAGLEFLGLKLDLVKNADSPLDRDIATPESKIKVMVIHTEEDWAIAYSAVYKIQQ